MTVVVEERRWLFVLPWSPSAVGGVSQVVVNMIAQAQRCLGYSPTLVVNDWQALTESLLPNEPCPASRLRVITPLDDGNPLWTGFTYLVRLPGQIIALRRVIRRQRVAVINPHFPDLSALTWLLAVQSIRLRTRPRVVLAFHGQDAVHAAEGGWLASALWNLTFRLADHVVACSTEVANRLSSNFPIHPVKLRVVDNGIDADLLSREAGSSPSQRIGAPYILSLGTFEAKKGHDTLIRAFETIQHHHPELCLVIAGRRGSSEYMEMLEEIRQASSAPGRIIFLQDLSHQEAMSLLLRARIFALASRVEPFGIAVLEAIALAKPTVVTSICGIVPRLGKDAFSGIVPPDDPVALAASLERTLSDYCSASATAALTASFAVSRFSWLQVLQNWPERQMPNTETRLSS